MATDFPIVGLGASAGGLDALQRFFRELPEEPGMAFVVIQHLSPDHKSLTSELLAKQTKMRIAEVDDGPRVRVNRAYVIPPGKYLSVSDGELQLSEPTEARGHRMAVDFFLRSLAAEPQQSSVAIILSGTGSDGTIGAKLIKEVGGLVIAQDPATAVHDGMPRSIINTGMVDHVLAPEAMAELLVEYAQHPYIRENDPAIESNAEPSDGLRSILTLLRRQTKYDFLDYKTATLNRRIHRRMCLRHMDNRADYHELLETDSDEVDALVRDLLIAVTNFFRDPEAWDELRIQVIVPLVGAKPTNEPIRIWTAGCATGEEAYSLAMLFIEELAIAKKHCPLTVFASDLDKEALEFARAGRYPNSIEADVSEERLQRFFVSEGGGSHYRIGKQLREAVVFAEQNLLADPPYSRLDLVTCRNVLIYLKPATQDRLLALFHFALLEGGYLFLGSAETIGRQEDIFEILAKRWRLYRRIGPTRHDRLALPLSTNRQRSPAEPTRPISQEQRRNRLARLAEHWVLDWLAPAAVLIDRQWHILYVCGPIDNYLVRPVGIPSDNLLDNLRSGLRNAIRGAFQNALDHGRLASADVQVQRGGVYFPLRVHVRPIREPGEADETVLLILFEEMQTSDVDNQPRRTIWPPQLDPPSSADLSAQDIIRQLEVELAAVKDDLQATQEQMAANNEEQRAASEEVMSINEELQSTNEELETSKEELQSLNEELSTVNSQLNVKVEEAESRHADLENLLAVTEIATVCLDTALKIRWFTPAVTSLFRLTDSDRGRPLVDFAHEFTDRQLIDSAQRVLERLVAEEQEVQTQSGQSFVRRITPYRLEGHRIGGVVVTFIDISERKRIEAIGQEIRELPGKIVDTLREPILVLDESLIVRAANPAFYDSYRVKPTETIGQPLNRLSNGQWNIPKLRDLLAKVLADGEIFSDYEVEHDFEEIGPQTMLLNARRIHEVNLVLLAIENVSERRRNETRLAENEERLRLAAESAGLGSYDHDLVNQRIYWSPELVQLAGLDESTQRWQRFDTTPMPIHPDDRATARGRLLASFDPDGDGLLRDEFRIVWPDSSVRWLSIRGATYFDGGGAKRKAIRATGVVLDITQRKVAEIELEEMNHSLEQQVEARIALLSIVHDTAVAANQADAVDEAVQAFLERLCHHNHWRLGFYAQVDENEEVAVVTDIWYVSSSLRNDPRHRTMVRKFHTDYAGQRFTADDPLIGSVLKQGCTVYTENIAQLTHWKNNPIGMGLNVAVAFPIRVDGRIAAIVECFSQKPIPNSEPFLEILTNVGIQIGHVIERKELERSIDEVAIQQQRHLAQELHDSVAQDLAGAQMNVESMRQALLAGDVDPDQIKVLKEQLIRTSQKVRQISHGLMPVIVEAGGIIPALENLADQTREFYHIDCSFHGDDITDKQDNFVATHLYRIIQEAVQNAVKHGHARNIRIVLQKDGNEMAITVRDDGVGFPPEMPRKGGIGLQIMQHRASLIGARLSFESRLNLGVTLTCQFKKSSLLADGTPG